MFDLVLKALEALAGAVGVLINLGNERRAKIALHCDNISNVMQKYVDSRRQGKESPALCRELEHYAKNIRDVASPTLQSEKVEHEIDQLVNELENVCNNMKILSIADASGNKSYDKYLDEIESASGSFRGFANSLRAM